MTFAYFDDLVTDEGQAAFSATMARSIRAGKLDEAEAYLSRHLVAASPELWEICAQSTLDQMTIKGWERLASAAGDAATDPVVIGVTRATEPADDQSGVSLSATIVPRETGDLVLVSREQLLDRTAAGDLDWLTEDHKHNAIPIFLDGITELHTMIEEELARIDRPDAGSDAAIALFLAQWWRTLRLHQSVERAWKEAWPQANVPVLVGPTGLGPLVVSVLWGDEGTAPDVEESKGEQSCSDGALPVAEEAEAVPVPDTGALRGAPVEVMPVDTPVMALSEFDAPYYDPFGANASQSRERSFSVVELRRRLAVNAEPDAEPAKPRLLARILGRG